ncbi:MAG: hypothetical protein U5K37_11640 [Natrialbaceae archaeon]|nr:hypothetical protein [Natrialbaceae archaeon]
MTDRDHRYVLVGGYAVSAFNPRFSTDLDLVVASRDEAVFDEWLTSRGFEEHSKHGKTWFYDTTVIEYERRLAPKQPIGVRSPREWAWLSPD